MSTTASSKRRRPTDFDHDDAADECMGQQLAKRQCSLPLRLSPSASPRTHFTPHVPPPTLTPAESSDEEIGDDERVQVRSALNNLRSSGAASLGAESNGVEMTDMPPPPAADPWRKAVLARRRANGISFGTAPTPISSSNPDQTDPNGGRIPTPVYGHFVSTDVNMDTSEAAMNSFIHPAARLQLRHNHNVLSPMMSEDGESEADWWRRRRLPSPVDSPVMPHKTDMDDLTSPGIGTMNLLSFDNVQAHNSHLPDDAGADINLTTPTPTPNSSRSSNKGHAMFERQSDLASAQSRKGKLVMGFRSDCDKCQKRAPGHYSHIVWS